MDKLKSCSCGAARGANVDSQCLDCGKLIRAAHPTTAGEGELLELLLDNLISAAERFGACQSKQSAHGQTYAAQRDEARDSILTAFREHRVRP